MSICLPRTALPPFSLSSHAEGVGLHLVEALWAPFWKIQIQEFLPSRHHPVDFSAMPDAQFRHLPCRDHPHPGNCRVPRVPDPPAFLHQVVCPTLHLLVERVFARETGRDQVRHHELLLPGVDGHVPVTRGYEDELPHLCRDSDNVMEIAPLEEVERLPGEHLVEFRIADA